MTVVAIVVGGVVALWLLAYAKARSIVGRHAQTLSRATGIPAAQIAAEIRSTGSTPGEWAARHGLDPLTFERRS